MPKQLKTWKATIALIVVNAVIAGFMMTQPAQADAQSGSYARQCQCNIVDKRCDYVDIGCATSSYSTCAGVSCPG